MVSCACLLEKIRRHIQQSTSWSQFPLAHMEAINYPTPLKTRSELSPSGTQQMNKYIQYQIRSDHENLGLSKRKSQQFIATPQLHTLKINYRNLKNKIGWAETLLLAFLVLLKQSQQSSTRNLQEAKVLLITIIFTC